MGLQQVIEKADKDQVLDKILDKIQSLKSLGSGTDAGDSISGLTELAKTALAPLQTITHGISQMKKTYDKFKNGGKTKEQEQIEQIEKLSKQVQELSDQNHQLVLDHNEKQTAALENLQNLDGVAQDEQIIDFSGVISNLLNEEIQVEKLGFDQLSSDLDELGVLKNHRTLLSDISAGVQQLVYGTEEVVHQLQKNQKNTRVFQVQKKESDKTEKDLAQLERDSFLSEQLAEKITNQLVVLDENLQNQIYESIQQDKHDSEEYTQLMEEFQAAQRETTEALKNQPDAEFPEIQDKLKDAEDRKDKTEKKSVWTSVKNIARFVGHMAKAAIMQMLSLAAQTAIIGAIVIGIDLLQAVLRTKFDQWGVTMENWQKILPDKIYDSLVSALKWVWENILVGEFMALRMALSLIRVGVAKVVYNIKDQIANLVQIFSDTWAEKIRKGAQEDHDAVINEHNQFQRDYIEQGKKQYNLLWQERAFVLGKVGDFKTVAEMEAESQKGVKDQVAQDKLADPNAIKRLSNGDEVQLNQNISELKDMLTKASREGDFKTAKELEAFIKIADAYQAEVERENGQIFRRNGSWFGRILSDMEEKVKKWFEFDHETKARHAREQAKEAENRLKAREKYQTDQIQATNPEEIKAIVAEQTRKELQQYDPAMHLMGYYQPPAPQNNVQMNNQQNTTNIIQQPMSVNNNYNSSQTVTNIGTR